MNEWKKKCVGLQRTWVSKRTVLTLPTTNKRFLDQFQGAQFVPPAFAVFLPKGTGNGLQAAQAADGSFVRQSLVMLSFVIYETDVSFHYQVEPPTSITSSCTQHLLVARLVNYAFTDSYAHLCTYFQAFFKAYLPTEPANRWWSWKTILGNYSTLYINLWLVLFKLHIIFRLISKVNLSFRLRRCNNGWSWTELYLLHKQYKLCSSQTLGA